MCYLFLDHKFGIILASRAFGLFDVTQDEQLDSRDIIYVYNRSPFGKYLRGLSPN